jgi:hypothetical protein
MWIGSIGYKSRVEPKSTTDRLAASGLRRSRGHAQPADQRLPIVDLKAEMGSVVDARTISGACYAPFLDLNYASLLARLGARRKLLVRTQPRNNPLSILLLAGMNHHLRRPLFLKHCLVFSEANVTFA